MTTTSTAAKSWKQAVRNYFMSEDNQAYLAYIGKSTFPYSLVKLEILDAKGDMNGPSEAQIKRDNEYSAIWYN